MKKLLVFAVLLLAAGCGIQPTAVVQAGLAPTMSNSSASGPNLTLYFVDQGRVVPSTRDIGTTVSPTIALNLLLRGPSSSELKQDLHSELPASVNDPITVDTRTYPAQVFIPFSLKELSGLAINQLVCTTIAALATSGSVSESALQVILTAQDGKLDPRLCQTF